MKKQIAMLMMLASATVILATPTVTGVSARQRYPWNGLVDIDVTVTGMEAGKIGLISCVASNLETKTALKMETVRYGNESVDTNFEVTSDGTYRLVWDAKTDLRTGRFERTQIYAEIKVKAQGEIDLNGHEGVQLWENGPYWATCNVGATKPEEAGYYFYWGDTVGCKRENGKWVRLDGSDNNFGFGSGNCPTYGKGANALTTMGYLDAAGNLTLRHDAAQQYFGGSWRMPTKGDLDELCSKTTWIWTTQDGMYGMLVKGNGEYADRSIFLPAAGCGDGSSLNGSGSYGSYWSASVNPSNSDYTDYLYFYADIRDWNNYIRSYGRSVRPVAGFTK